MISSRTIAQIVDAARIEDVVGEYVQLKKRGTNLLGLCPFHNEKTPSFIVSPAKGLYKCFGCSNGGNAIKFIMEHDKLSYAEALRYLAKRYRIEIEELDNQESRDKQTLTDTYYAINEFANNHFQENLHQSEDGKLLALSYFKERGFINETIKKFELGFAINKRDDLLQLAKSKGYDIKYFIDLGLVGEKNNWQYDFFSNRVMFPIHNVSGRVIAFSGRILGADKNTAKYINSPETELYHKSKVLYGMHLAKESVRKLNTCFLVEGYTDVISLHQAGIQNVVASSGTALTEDQCKLLKRHTPNVTILYDGDAAGIKAALRGTDLLLEQDLNVKVVILPDNHDPDSFVKDRGAEGMLKYIQEQADDFIFFKTKILLKDAENDPIKRTELIESVVQSIAKIPNQIKRNEYMKDCAKLLKVDERILISEINKHLRQDLRKKIEAYPAGQEQGETPTNVAGSENITVPKSIDGFALQDQSTEILEKELIRMLLTYGERKLDEDIAAGAFIIQELHESGIVLTNEVLIKILDIYYNALQNNEQLKSDYFVHFPEFEIATMAVNLITQKHTLSEKWLEVHEIFITDEDMNYRNTVINILNRYKLNRVMQMILENSQKLKDTQDENEQKKMLKIHIKLMEFQKQLSMELNTVIIK